MADLENLHYVYPLRKLGPEVTMTISVKVTREYRIRQAVALFLVKCACKILGAGIEVKKEMT